MKEEQCPDCQGEGKIPIGEHHVTRDMAIDACDLSLEGSLAEIEYAPCDRCEGGGVLYPEQNEGEVKEEHVYKESSVIRLCILAFTGGLSIGLMVGMTFLP